MSKSKKLSAIELRDRAALEKIARDRISEGLADLAKIEATGIWRKTHKTGSPKHVRIYYSGG